MKNTGVSQRPVSCHGAAIYATYRSFSAARLSDILPGSYLFRAISRFIAVLAGHSSALHASLIIIKENLPDVKPIFSVFYENMKIFLAGGFFFRFFQDSEKFPPIRLCLISPENRRRVSPACRKSLFAKLLAFFRTSRSSEKRLIENERHPSWVSFVAIFLPVFPNFRVYRQSAFFRQADPKNERQVKTTCRNVKKM